MSMDMDRLADMLDGLGVAWSRSGGIVSVTVEGRVCELKPLRLCGTDLLVYATERMHGVKQVDDRFDVDSLRNIIQSLVG